MRFSFLGKLATGMALCLGLATAAQATSSLTIVSEPGDIIGQGVTKSYTSSSALFGVNGNGESVTLAISTLSDSWYIVVAAPRGEKLTRGSYSLAERATIRTGRSPGVEI